MSIYLYYSSRSLVAMPCLVPTRDCFEAIFAALHATICSSSRDVSTSDWSASSWRGDSCMLTMLTPHSLQPYLLSRTYVSKVLFDTPPTSTRLPAWCAEHSVSDSMRVCKGDFRISTNSLHLACHLDRSLTLNLIHHVPSQLVPSQRVLKPQAGGSARCAETPPTRP